MPTVAYMSKLSYSSDNMPRERISALLTDLGLSEHESSVYGCLITLSPASAAHIAKRSGLSRSTVYTVLSALIAKGLVATTFRNEVKQFIAANVFDDIIQKDRATLEKRSAAAKSLGAIFEKFSASDVHVPQLALFEGQEGLKKVYLSMMRSAPMDSTLRLMRDEFVWQPEWKFVFDVEWHDRVKRWKREKNIRTKLLINPSSAEKKQRAFYSAKKGLDVRFLSLKHSIDRFAIYVLGDTILILSIETNNLVGIQMVNKNLAENFVQTFETIWQSADKK